MFTSLDLGMNGEEKYWMLGTTNIFWKTALSQYFSVWHNHGIDRETDFLCSGEGILSNGAVREMGRREPGWDEQQR